MRFGILLLLLIAAFSVLGTVIPQGREIKWYVETYPTAHPAILLLKLNDVFNSWYFLLLITLLGMNLTLCSLVRIRNVSEVKRKEKELLLKQPETYALNAEQRESVLNGLRAMHCKEEAEGSSLVFRKNSFGRYGSFITHLSILLTLIFGAGALYLPTFIDRDCFPGESVIMDDGTEIRVESFRIEDETGRLDFTSEIEVKLPDGRDSGVHEISVNHPLTFGPYKIYQQTYGTAGSITIRNLTTGGEDTFTLTELVFLTLDGVNGLWYEQLYPDMIRDPSGNVTLIANVSGSYPNPVYQVETASDGVYTPILAFVGDELQVNELLFRFEKPVEYPGLRIKYTPRIVNALLCASFLMMIAGFFITFFCQPVLVRVDETGCAISGPKPESMRLSVQEGIQENISEGAKQ